MSGAVYAKKSKPVPTPEVPLTWRPPILRAYTYQPPNNSSGMCKNNFWFIHKSSLCSEEDSNSNRELHTVISNSPPMETSDEEESFPSSSEML